ncbi:ROK family transcriptional regulator [Paenibacillus chondroitinus]|uniref:ROK family transcriptional regulator n=1 Tax=Paenibacillus chondroitinus TaxID=59842 RepID=A0ABU6DE66_9BACL|nr:MULTISPECIES: ROK family transcriptional regulator [Paenibacillus]MCY9662971.1 ROK family transcriptional regulator [Paenibacillus anseongense]MEB4795592.1 ROK family transcriptional regulator [Paenibacillus chondroitinus]
MISKNDMKERNRMSILKTIRRGVCSRADISATLGLSKPAVSALVDELIKEGLVYETGRGDSTEAGGKKPILLDFHANVSMIAAVSFNNKHYEVALVDLVGDVKFYVKKEIRISDDYRQTIDLIVQEIRDLIQVAREQGHQQPVIACGVAIRGLVDTKMGIMRYSSAMPWKDAPIGDYMEQSLDIPIFLENDARAGTYVELLNSNGTYGNSLVCVSVGLGIGTGVAIGNEVYRGAFDGAVNLAHATIDHDGPLCRCGNRGCWEALASITAFSEELVRRDGKYADLEFSEILNLYHEGDAVVADVLFNYTGYWLGVGITNILHTFNPEVLIIQGELTSVGPELERKIIEVVHQRVKSAVTKRSVIRFSEHSEKLQVRGAAAVISQYFFSDSHHRLIWK